MERIAFVDPLTGGINNTAFQLKCQRLSDQAPTQTYVIVMLNIKGFKLINKNFGIAAGAALPNKTSAKLVCRSRLYCAKEAAGGINVCRRMNSAAPQLLPLPFRTKTIYAGSCAGANPASAIFSIIAHSIRLRKRSHPYS